MINSQNLYRSFTNLTVPQIPFPLLFETAATYNIHTKRGILFDKHNLLAGKSTRVKGTHSDAIDRVLTICDITRNVALTFDLVVYFEIREYSNIHTLHAPR